MPIVTGIVVGAVCFGVALAGAIIRQRRQARQIVAAARAQASAVVRGGELEAASVRRAGENAAREEALELRARVDRELVVGGDKLAEAEAALADLEDEVSDYLRDVEARDDVLTESHKTIMAMRDRAKGLRKDTLKRREEAISALEQRTNHSSAEVRDRLIQRWIEDTRAEAAHRVRAVDQQSGDPATDREAQRVLDIAVSRYRNHFLTERLISNIPVTTAVAEKLIEPSGDLLGALQQVANVQLNVSESGDAVRLEGLDGVGREVARRALSRLCKKPKAMTTAEEDPVAWATNIREQLMREIVGLGRKAFSVLKVKKAHPEIVELVGRLNYRTSYTQNQWLHAVEASFLAGMMASEMGLDVRLARRATLMHDIGKALTHEIDGSHAVIGADIARRLGEDELIANAIGAHHLDEPMNSVYAHLVAAADAMSGARPGARREQTEGYSNRIEDLERIGRRYRGVDRCFAVHGGRELRVYVREDQVSDRDAVQLSGEIAEEISEEMVFPGQIKVTVIRATEAASTAN